MNFAFCILQRPKPALKQQISRFIYPSTFKRLLIQVRLGRSSLRRRGGIYKRSGLSRVLQARRA